MSEEIIGNQRSKAAISPKEIIFRYIHFLPWVLISVAVALTGAYIKLRYTTPIYSVSGKLLVASQSPYGSGGDKFDDIFMMQQRVDKLNDEIEIIKSRNMATRVIRSLGLQKQVYSVGKIRTSVVYPGIVPFNFDILSIADSAAGFSVAITFIGDTQFRLNEQPQKHFYNETINLPNASFRITSNGKDRNIFGSTDYIVTWQPAENLASGLSGAINVGRVNEVTNVLNLSYATENPQLGVDVVNRYMSEYQQANMQDKKQIAANTLEFIDEQLDTVFHELGGVERNLQKYREKNKVYSPESQTQLFLDEYSKGNTEQAQMQVKLKVTDYLIGYLSNDKNQHNVIPSTLGIEEPALLQQVTELNRLQLERETALKNTPANNPRILAMESGIEKLRLDMIETLKNVRHTQMLAMEELTGKRSETNRAISAIPAKEKQLLEVTRQQNILQELYQYLLQKKLETAIASASTISNIKVLEPALNSGGPISPNRKGMYIIAIFIGLALPVGIIFLLEFLDDKIRGKSDVQQGTDAPVLGEIGHADGVGALVVTRNNRKIVAEQFRMVRTNLQYIIPKVEKPVLLVTSSFSGEGKSFISTNLGAVLAISGKRTVILEFDIRKPKIMKGLGLHERKGITNYIVGSAGLNEIIHPVPDVENLYVISCGPVPPNPAEMLLQGRVDELFLELRKQFDAIIIDSAPVGLVSDAVTLGRYADGTIYIVRHKYTLKKQIQMVDDIYRQKKLPHLAIVINDISSRGGYGGYYGYGSYGYGYGYGVNGNGGGYFDNGTPARKGWRKWIRGSIKKSD
jgi:capsular exopolysaccharide synthesis family protein